MPLLARKCRLPLTGLASRPWQNSRLCTFDSGALTAREVGADLAVAIEVGASVCLLAIAVCDERGFSLVRHLTMPGSSIAHVTSALLEGVGSSSFGTLCSRLWVFLWPCWFGSYALTAVGPGAGTVVASFLGDGTLACSVALPLFRQKSCLEVLQFSLAASSNPSM